MAWLRSNADLLMMALALGVVSLAYASGSFILALSLHPVGQHGWRPAEIVAVGAYPLAWVFTAWGVTALRDRWRRRHRGA
jgi:hypothetical protein